MEHRLVTSSIKIPKAQRFLVYGLNEEQNFKEEFNRKLGPVQGISLSLTTPPTYIAREYGADNHNDVYVECSSLGEMSKLDKNRVYLSLAAAAKKTGCEMCPVRQTAG